MKSTGLPGYTWTVTRPEHEDRAWLNVYRRDRMLYAMELPEGLPPGAEAAIADALAWAMHNARAAAIQEVVGMVGRLT